MENEKNDNEKEGGNRRKLAAQNDVAGSAT